MLEDGENMHEPLSKKSHKEQFSQDSSSIITSTTTKEPYYKADSFELYLSDCREFLMQIPPESVDMIFTSFK
ncbi:MAG: hypothetical protein QW728_05335 [Thermoplasmata archaeon]